MTGRKGSPICRVQHPGLGLPDGRGRPARETGRKRRVGRIFYTPAADAEMNRQAVAAIQVLCYGFITLISLIALVNVFNTMSTNLMLRRREFAMLRSVGMTGRSFRLMLGYECVIYGLRSLCTAPFCPCLSALPSGILLPGRRRNEFIFPGPGLRRLWQACSSS